MQLSHLEKEYLESQDAAVAEEAARWEKRQQDTQRKNNRVTIALVLLGLFGFAGVLFVIFWLVNA